VRNAPAISAISTGELRKAIGLPFGSDTDRRSIMCKLSRGYWSAIRKTNWAMGGCANATSSSLFDKVCHEVMRRMRPHGATLKKPLPEF
jgi:hypothetical protein